MRSSRVQGETPQSFSPRTPIPARGRCAPRKVHPVGNGALARTHPKRRGDPRRARESAAARVPAAQDRRSGHYPFHRRKGPAPPRARPTAHAQRRGRPCAAPRTPDLALSTPHRPRKQHPTCGGMVGGSPFHVCRLHPLRERSRQTLHYKPPTKIKVKFKTKKSKSKSRSKPCEGAGAAKGAG
jgi:hypothetical protein